MKSIAILLLSLGSFTVTAQQQPTLATGSLRRFDNFPSKFVDPRTVDVWLPDGYDTKNKYAVLYRCSSIPLPPGTNRNGAWTRPWAVFWLRARSATAS